MKNTKVVSQSSIAGTHGSAPCAEPATIVIFGASGDLTKRLLLPALWNLYCDNLLSDRFAIIGASNAELTTEEFRNNLTENIQDFSTRDFEPDRWAGFVKKFSYLVGNFGDPKLFKNIQAEIDKVSKENNTGGNVLYYTATPPVVFGLLARMIGEAGMNKSDKGWRRLIIEKPFGSDLESCVNLSKDILTHWEEDQIYRIDHYLGKETVQNLLTFRFSNGIFEPLWNKNYVDHIQFTVAERVGVELRGGYYDKTGVLKDMMQNHMFQMLAYLCMETPNSFQADAIRNEKAKLLEAVRIMEPQAVLEDCVRGQYGPGTDQNDEPMVGYRQAPDVNPESHTETFAAVKLHVDNWRWVGVPIYLRSGKALSRKYTEIVIRFKKAPEVLFRDTPVDHLEANELVFNIQPEQGIEIKFQAKVPGVSMHLQNVRMQFEYEDAFQAARGTGYERLIYDCMVGDATLFSRTDLVEQAWRIAQPILDVWRALPARDFPNYTAGTWGPKSANNLLARDGRAWRIID
ncbi:MAG: glucose-6-phosphate dehydrogenase [Planctomycetota bacterium]|nr:glucose-6-phosphate dehydrogenase [Planctomycetota bacterium]